MDEHTGFCLKSVFKNNLNNLEISETENFMLFEALESVYPLLDIIFSFLNDNDLKQMSLVKKSWKEMIDRICKSRSKVSWVTCYKKKRSNILKYSNSLHYNNTKIGILLYDCRRLNLNKYICLHTDTTKLRKMTFVEYLAKEIVPSDVNYCLLSCPKASSYFTTDLEANNGSIFDGLFLPEINGIRISMFHCNLVKLKKEASIIEEHIKPEEEVKCLLLFSSTDLQNSINYLFDILLRGVNAHDVAVGGGIIRGTKTFQEGSQKIFYRNDIFCIAFLKKQNTNPQFNAASFVMTGNDYSKEEFETDLVQFKKRVILRHQSAAFRICCGAKWDKSDESSIFNKLFPQTPLLGLEANGEVGWNCFNLPSPDTEIEKTSKKRKTNYPQVVHQWSTVFVLITWGEIVINH